jgi:hypothetical protein
MSCQKGIMLLLLYMETQTVTGRNNAKMSNQTGARILYTVNSGMLLISLFGMTPCTQNQAMLHGSRPPGVPREEHIPELRSSFYWSADQHRLKREIAAVLQNLLSHCADSVRMLNFPSLPPPSHRRLASSLKNSVVRNRAWRLLALGDDASIEGH